MTVLAPSRLPADFRREFPVLDRTVHLAGCSLAPRSTTVDSALARMLETMTSGPEAWHEFQQEVEDARRGFARLIGASPDQVAVVPNASVGAYQVISTIHLGRRNRVVTMSEEFPSIAHVWLAQRGQGGEVVYADDGATDLRSVDPASYGRVIHDRTALVSVPLVTYGTGRLLPVAEVAHMAHARGARVFVDAYQAVGVLPVDVDVLRCDYLVAGTQKYLLGLPGLAFLYARESAAGDTDPVLTGWFGRVDPFAFDARRLDFPRAARRFETGTVAVPSVYAGNAGMGLIADLDLHEVQRYVTSLRDLAVDRLTAQGERMALKPAGVGHGAHVALAAADSQALQAWLAERGVNVSARGNFVRLSFHYYNAADDIERLCDALVDFRSRPVPRAAPLLGRRPVLEQLGSWLADPEPARFPFDAVVAEFLRTGKHFVSSDLLTALAQAEAWLPEAGSDDEATALLRHFLGTALDKWNQVYDYPTYTALRVLPICSVDDPPELLAAALPRRDRLMAHLVADLVRFELAVADGTTDLLPELRPPDRTRDRRIRLALRAVTPALLRLGLAGGISSDDPEQAARRLCATVERDLSPLERRILQLSMLPVYVAHDEYLFIRVLQMFETTFALLAVQLRAAVRSLAELNGPEASTAIDLAATTLRESAPLLSLLATMQPHAFRTFREFTHGASAIQSRNYKLLESLCRRPDTDRLDSPAFRSVPEIRDQIAEGNASLDDVFEAACVSERLAPSDLEEVEAAMGRFSSVLMRWRTSHYRLAVRMLGESSGTGATQGVPYLKSVERIPVFRSVEPSEGGDSVDLD